MASKPAEDKRNRLARTPIHPLLFAAYPILFLFGQNLDGVAIGEVTLPLMLAVAVAAACLVVGSLVFRNSERVAIVVSAAAIGALTYGHGQRIASSIHMGGLGFVALWVVAAVLVLVFAFRVGAQLPSVTRTLNLVAVVLVALQLVTIAPYEARALTGGRIQTGPVLAANQTHTTRDIYYIVLDRYGSARSLALNYGVTDDGFYDWLAGHGFIVAPDSHANYVRTGLSMAATLNMTFLDEVARQQGPDSSDQGPINAMLADHAVGRFLKAEGYRYYHVGSYFSPTQVSTIADVNRHLGGASDFGAAVYDETVFPSLARRLGLSPATPSRERHADNARYEFQALGDLRSEPGPKFVFAHILLPHPPYVFGADGQFLSDDQEAKLSAREQFHQQLLFTNSAMMSFLEPVVSLPEAERPIIIIQADEGPYPPHYSRDTIHYDWSTATPDELEVKYGILNAMLLPGVDPSAVYPTISSVNTFRMLFDRYFGADLPLLPDRSFTSAGKLRPYDLTDVTDRLPTLH